MSLLNQSLWGFNLSTHYTLNTHTHAYTHTRTHTHAHASPVFVILTQFAYILRASQTRRIKAMQLDVIAGHNELSASCSGLINAFMRQDLWTTPGAMKVIRVAEKTQTCSQIQRALLCVNVWICELLAVVRRRHCLFSSWRSFFLKRVLSVDFKIYAWTSFDSLFKLRYVAVNEHLTISHWCSQKEPHLRARCIIFHSCGLCPPSGPQALFHWVQNVSSVSEPVAAQSAHRHASLW